MVVSSVVHKEERKLAENKSLAPSNMLLVDIADTGAINNSQQLHVPMKMNTYVLPKTESQSLHIDDLMRHYYSI